MSIEINADKVVMKVHETSVALAKSAGRVIVCETSSNLDVTANSNSRKTKCYTIVTVDDPDVVLSGSGVAQANTDSDEVSAMDILAWMKTKKLLYFDYKNMADATNGITAGDVVALSGEGKFSKLTITSDIDDPVVTFDWEFTVGGDWSYVP